MPILSRSALPLSNAHLLAAPFCDYLNVSFPSDVGDLVDQDLSAIYGEVGASQVAPGRYQVGKDGGTFKRSRRGKVAIFSASGSAISSLRSIGQWPEYLRVLSSHPHRVTLLHATADYGLAGPSVVAAAHRLGLAGAVAFTRKRVAPSAVKCLTSLDAGGELTGTVYFGHRANSDVWGKVYDKRHERLSRGFPDPGPMVRVEIAVHSDVGATLSDAFAPVDLYYSLASPSLVEAPQCFAGWVPRCEGFVCPASAPADPMRRIKGILDTSLDVGRIVKAARDAFGADAATVLARLIAQRVAQRAAPQ